MRVKKLKVFWVVVRANGQLYREGAFNVPVLVNTKKDAEFWISFWDDANHCTAKEYFLTPKK